MTDPQLLDRPRPVGPPGWGATTLRRPRRRALVAVLALAVIALLSGGFVVVQRARDDAGRDYLAATGWPRHGQAAYSFDGVTQASPAQRAVPIASLAKVMTAYLVLRARPLGNDRSGSRIVVTRADVVDTARRRSQQQSVVAVRAGERLTERQALLAVLLPSANNVAAVLARWTAGSLRAFVSRMNATARALGMRNTHYTDPSGFDARTVSTAADQLILARTVAANPTFTALTAHRSARLPVVGTVHNTDALLGHDGFVGTKTGSDDAAGGCFMFRRVQERDGRRLTMLGVVLGQHGHSLLAAGLYAARQLARRVAGPA